MTDHERRQWMVALADPDTARLQRAGMPASWATPTTVLLEDGKLRWNSADPLRVVAAPRRLLDRLLNLSGADDETAAEFANTIGVIVLCDEHTLPLSHARRADAYGLDEPVPCHPLGGPEPFTPVEWMRVLARQSRAILNIAVRLRRDVAGEDDDWAVLNPDYARDRHQSIFHWKRVDTTPEHLLDEDRETLAEYVNRLLALADIRFRLDWSTGDRPQFVVSTNTLYGALVTTLAYTVAGTGIGVCSACGNVYTPAKAPTPGKPSYCKYTDCVRSRASAAQRRSRAKRART